MRAAACYRHAASGRSHSVRCTRGCVLRRQDEAGRVVRVTVDGMEREMKVRFLRVSEVEDRMQAGGRQAWCRLLTQLGGGG